MKKLHLLFLYFAISVGFAACAGRDAVPGSAVKQDVFQSGSSDASYVELHKVNERIWVHVSYANYNGSRTPSNGVMAVTSKGLVLIDSPWNNEQTRELLKLAKNIFKKDVTHAVITHAHDDWIGGIEALLENKVDVRSTSLTAKEAEKNGFKRPQATLDSEPKITVGDVDLEIFYPGEGHSRDNITVWFPKQKVLFGGCLIKSQESGELGSITDANLQQWPSSVKKVLERYSNAEVVIPGHGKWGNMDLARHTLKLLEK